MVDSLDSPRRVKELLRQHHLRPDKALGQHFMIDPSALQRVIEAASLEGRESVLEVGPGLGALTALLAEDAASVTAVEVDRRLAAILHERFGGEPRVRIVVGDILQLDLAELMDESGYIVVANIPYNITSRLIRRLLEAAKTPSRLVLTMQREVAERIVAAPGQMSLLALSVQLFGRPRMLGAIAPQAFYPPPKVESAILRVDLDASRRYSSEQISSIFRLARAGFAQRRKNLRNALSAGLGRPRAWVEALLDTAAIPANTRAQQVSLEEWAGLADVLIEMEAPDSREGKSKVDRSEQADGA